MKKLLAVVGSVFVLALPGCGSAGGLFTPTTAQVPVVKTNTVTVVQTVLETNTIVVLQTNGVTVTNVVVQVIPTTNVVTTLTTNVVTVTNGYTVSSGVQSALSGASTVNTLTGAVDPYSAPIALGLGLLSAALGWWAKLKSKQAATQGSAAQTVITAIEGLEPAASAAVKAAVTAKAAQMGTGPAVSSVVSAVTANL